MTEPRNVAIVCDWLSEVGGAERVILAVHELFPEAPIYTSQYRPARAPWFKQADVRVGWLDKLPIGLKRFIPFLRQFYFSRLDLSTFDLVISITGAEAKAVRTRPDARHISYMHAPTQYYWSLYDQYIAQPGFGALDPVARLGLKLLVGPLRKADYKAAQNPDEVIANSSYVQAEIKRFYGRESTVVWPNVAVETIAERARSVKGERRGFIIFGRQVAWKRIDLAIDAALQTGHHLTVIGNGPEHDRLVERATGAAHIEFLPSYDGIEEITERLAASEAFIFPSLEPFGISPVEALAAGTPVIALKKGGALDFITEQNGLFFEAQTVESLAAAMRRFDQSTFDPDVVAASAEKFSEAAFKRHFTAVIDEV